MAHMLPWGSLEILVERYLPVIVIWLSYCHWCLCNAGSVWWGGPTFIIAAIYPYIELPLLLARVETENAWFNQVIQPYSCPIYEQIISFSHILSINRFVQFRHFQAYWNYFGTMPSSLSSKMFCNLSKRLINLFIVWRPKESMTETWHHHSSPRQQIRSNQTQHPHTEPK